MSVDVSTFVWLTSKQRNSALLMMLALADFSNDEGQCWPGLPALAKRVRTTVRNAQLILRKLEDDGAIAVDMNGGCETPTGKTNRYTIAGFADWFKEVKKISPHSKPKGVKRTSPRQKQGVKFSATEGVKSFSPDPSFDPSLNTDVSKDTSLSHPAAGASDATGATDAPDKAVEPEAKREGGDSGKLYLSLGNNRYQGPYAPYSEKRPAGTYLAAEMLPPGAVIVPLATPAPKPKAPRKAQPTDALFDAVADHIFGAKDKAGRQAVWGLCIPVVNGDKKHGRCIGLVDYECMRQGRERNELDYNQLADDVGKFWTWFRAGHPDIKEVNDCAKVLKYWQEWRGNGGSASEPSDEWRNVEVKNERGIWVERRVHRDTLATLEWREVEWTRN